MKWSNQKLCHVELTNVPCIKFTVTEVPARADTYWGFGVANIQVGRDNKVTGTIEATTLDMLPIFIRDPGDNTRGYILIPTAMLEGIQNELGDSFRDGLKYEGIKRVLQHKYGQNTQGTK